MSLNAPMLHNSINQAGNQSINQPLLHSFILAEKVSKFNEIINSRVGVVALIGQILPNVTVYVALLGILK